MSKINVKKILNPIEKTAKEHRTIVFKENETVYECLTRDGIDVDDYTILVNGYIVKNPENVFLSNLDNITIIPVLGGDDRTKAMVAMVAVSAVAVYAGGPLGGILAKEFTFLNPAVAEFMVQTGVMIAGGFIVNQAFDLQPDMPGGVNNSATYNWSESNPSNEGLVVPIVFGTTKVTPPIVSSSVDVSRDSFIKWSDPDFYGGSDRDAYSSTYRLMGKDNDMNSLTMRMLLADHKIKKIQKVMVDDYDLDNYENLIDSYLDYYDESGLNTDTYYKHVVTLRCHDEDKRLSILNYYYYSSMREVGYFKTGDNVSEVPLSAAIDQFRTHLGEIFLRLDTGEAFIIKERENNFHYTWTWPSSGRFMFYFEKITDPEFVKQINSLPVKKEHMRLYQGYNLQEIPKSMFAYGICRRGLKWDFYTPIETEGGMNWQFHSVLPQIIEWERVRIFSTVDSQAYEELLNDGSYRKYEMCFDLGDKLFWSLKHQDEYPSNFYTDYKRGGYAHKIFHHVKGFRGFKKVYAELNEEDWLTVPPGLDPSEYIVKKNDHILLDSSVFDKNVIQQELYPGSRDSENPVDPEFLYISPKQESNSDTSRKKSVYVSVTLPQGLYKIENDGDKSGHKVRLRFEVKNESDSEWKIWDWVCIYGNVHGSSTVFIGPFNGNHSKRELYHGSLGGPAPGSDYEATTTPPADPAKLNLSSLPKIEENMEIRVIFEEQPKLKSSMMEKVVIDTVYSYYDYDLQLFPGSSIMDLRLGASQVLNTRLPKVDMILEAVDIEIEREDGENLSLPSNLPPWQILKLLTDPDFGEGIPFDDILMDTFDEWKEFCIDKKLFSNYVIDFQGSFDDVVGPIYNLGRAYPIQIGTKHGVAIDKKTDSISQVFNEENIVADSFSVDYLPEDEKANIFAIKFRDKNINYEQRTVEFRLPDITIDKERRVDLTLNNCTDYNTAHAHAQYMAKSNYYCNKIVKFTSHLDSIACQVGDVINVNYRGISWGDHHSRILEKLSSDRYRVSGEYEFQDGKQYFAIIRSNSDDKVHEMKVYNGSTEDTPAETTDIIVENGFHFFNESIVTIGERVKENKYRVTSITRHDDFHRDITAIEYNDKVYEPEFDFEDDITQEDELDGEPRYLSVKEIHIEGKKASLVASWSGGKSNTLLKVYHKGELILSRTVSGNQYYIPVPDTVKINDILKITIQKEGSNSLLPDQIVDRVYKGVPDHVGENIYSVSANFSSDKVVLDIKPDLPEYVDYCSVFMHYEDSHTSRQKIEYISGKVDSFPYIINKTILPGKYKFEIIPYKNNKKVIAPIISKIFNVGSNDTDHTYTPKVTGLRLADNTASWNTRDLEIVWNPITAYYEAGAGSAEAGAGVTESKKSILYNVVIKNSNLEVIHDSTTTEANFKYLYEQNVEDNEGIPEPNLIVLVTAVNEETGENSPDPAILNVTHEIPTIDEFNKKAFLGGVFFKWSVLNPDLIKEYKYKTIVTESETAPVWSGLEWMAMIGDVHSTTFPDKDEEGKYVHFLLKAVNIYNQESLIVTGFKQPECFRVEPKDIEDFALDASKMFLRIPVLENEEWSGNSSNIVSWNAHQLYYSGKRFNISAGLTTQKYIYFKLPPNVDFNDKLITEYSCSYNTSDLHPGDEGILGQHDFIIVVNVNGHAEVAWNAIANQVIGSAYIMDGAINNAHISSLSADKISLGPEKFWAESAGADNTQLALNLGVDIKNVMADGSIFMQGGLINAELIDVDNIRVKDTMIIGRIGLDYLDGNVENKYDSQAKADAAEAKAKDASLPKNEAGALAKLSKIDDSYITSIKGDKIKTGLIESPDSGMQIDLDTNCINFSLPQDGGLYFKEMQSNLESPAIGGFIRRDGACTMLLHNAGMLELSSRSYDYNDQSAIVIRPESITFRAKNRVGGKGLALVSSSSNGCILHPEKQNDPTKEHAYIGYSTRLFDGVYAYNFYDENGFFQDSLDDLKILHNIKPKDGVVDEKTGLEIIDVKSLPKFMTNYDSLKADVKNELGSMIDIDNDFDDLIRDDDQLGYRLKRNISAFNDHTNGAVRQLDNKVNNITEQLSLIIEDLYEHIDKLESELKECKLKLERS